MMHCDYQLAYCPITYILALAQADRAFKNERLTPEYILRLRVPPRLHTLPILWKEEVLRVPLLRHIENTPYGVRVHSEKHAIRLVLCVFFPPKFISLHILCSTLSCQSIVVKQTVIRAGAGLQNKHGRHGVV